MVAQLCLSVVLHIHCLPRFLLVICTLLGWELSEVWYISHYKLSSVWNTLKQLSRQKRSVQSWHPEMVNENVSFLLDLFGKHVSLMAMLSSQWLLRLSQWNFILQNHSLPVAPMCASYGLHIWTDAFTMSSLNFLWRVVHYTYSVRYCTQIVVNSLVYHLFLVPYFFSSGMGFLIF